MPVPNIRPLTSHDISAMLAIAVAAHARLRESLPFLPRDAARALAPKLKRLAEDGVAFGVVEDGTIRAFFGALVIPELRGAALGGLTFEWAYGSADPGTAASDTRFLYRELAAALVRRDALVHSISVFPTDAALEAVFVQLGFGRFLANRAVPLADLLTSLEGAQTPAGYAITRAVVTHAADLARMHALLEAHLEASPVFLAKSETWSRGQWEVWLREEDAVAFVAKHGGRPVGYIKAQEPQLDVTYAVHGEGVLGINGMFVEQEHRGTGIARALLAAMAEEAGTRGKRVLSVDHETANLEADAFWNRYFRPVSWALERRV